MYKYLFVVDVQKEFVKDKMGEKVYQKCLQYIDAHRHEYDAVIAAVYINDPTKFANMNRLLNWNDCKKIENLEFIPDGTFMHSGYSIKEYPSVTKLDCIDIIGFDTDACVLSACFDIFNLGCNMRILSEYIWSSGGKKMHEAGIAVMRRQFGKALI